MRAASFTVRVIGPAWERLHAALAGYTGTRPKDGLCPTMPQNDAGFRIDPPPSVPRASGPRPEATAAPAPPEEPPRVRSRFHGFRVTPKTRLSVMPTQPNVGVLVLPRRIPPAAFMRPTASAPYVVTVSG